MSTTTRFENGRKLVYKYRYRHGNFWGGCAVGYHEDCRAEIHLEHHQRGDVYERCPCPCHHWEMTQ